LTIAVVLSLATSSYAADETTAADSPAKSSVRDLSAYYEKPGVDLSQYTAILLDNLSVDDARVLPPPWYQGADSGLKKWQLTDADLQWLRKSYREAMQAEITGKGGYPIVAEPGKGALILDVAIIYLMPYARKGEEVETRGFGEMLVQAQLRDGMTQELLAVYEGKQEIGSGYQQNTRLNNENSLRELFQVWGTRMRGILDSQKLE
jgi:hypothetical protein